MPAPSLENLTEDQRNSIALKRMLQNPDVNIRMRAKKLWKEIEPTANFPDLEQHEQTEALKAEFQAKLDKLEQERLEESVKQRREKNHRMIADAGLTVEAVEKVMTEERILEYGTAIKYLQGQRALAPPTPESITPIRMPDNLKDIQKDPNKWARLEAHNALNEIIAQRAGAGR